MPIECRQLSPKHVITDILRIAGTKPFPNDALIEIGDLFAFSANAMRVALNRLENSNIIEKAISSTAGTGNATLHFQLCSSTNLLSDFIEEWKGGAERVKPWNNNHWLVCHLPKKPDRSMRTRSIRALGLLGFHPSADNLWVRPDNLSTGFERVNQQLLHFGLEPDAYVLGSTQMSPQLSEQWQSQWLSPENKEAYEIHYPDMIASLKQSQQRLAELSTKDAMIETFQLGSNTIHMLTKDPLVPEQLLPNNSRNTLCHTMLEYDAAGRKIWLQKIDDIINRTL
ncbi:hypothetical protein A9Q99_16790 [Gammaproteobacteria bacterium 45_16_T64]|nr:hypothetical protein A9Q99_16790 [Gammaproteobacteria bacterium 45_16_T64]